MAAGNNENDKYCYINEADAIIKLKKLSETLNGNEITFLAFKLGLKFEDIYIASSAIHIIKLFKIWKTNYEGENLAKFLINRLDECGLLQKFYHFDWSDFTGTDNDLAKVYDLLSIEESFELCRNLGVNENEIKNAQYYISLQKTSIIDTFEILKIWWQRCFPITNEKTNNMSEYTEKLSYLEKCISESKRKTLNIVKQHEINKIPSLLTNYTSLNGENNIIEREEWGARIAMNETPLKKPVSMVFILHTVTFTGFNVKTGKYHSKSCVQYIQNYHIDTLQWDDIAYNFLIGLDKNIYVGRGWSNMGAHVKGYNGKSISIAVIGDFMKEDAPIWLEDIIMKLLKIGVANGTLSTNFEITAHRDVSNTLSPGDNIYRQMKRWKHYGKTFI